MAYSDNNDEFLSGFSTHIDELFFPEEENYRSATVLQQKTIDQVDHDFRPCESTAKQQIETVDVFPTLQLVDLTFSLLKCCTSDPIAELWTSVLSFFANCPLVDYEVNSEAKVLYGNCYKTIQDCSFLVSVATLKNDEEKRSVVDVQRLSGDAFLLQELFEEMKSELRQTVFLEEDGEDNYDEASSSDEEDSEDDEYAFSNCENVSQFPDLENEILRFENDLGLLKMMLNNYEKTHLEEKNYYMSMLAHTSHQEDNKSLMLGETYVDKVKTMICSQLEASKDCSNATLIRNTCVLLNNLVEDMEVDNRMLTALVKTIGEWCPGKQNTGKYIGYLQSSSQVMFIIDQIMAKVMKINQNSEEKIVEIMYQELEENEMICTYAQENLLEDLGKLFTKL